MATIRTTGASLTNSVDINANSISLFDDATSKYLNIEKVFVNNSQIISAIQNENKEFEYPIEEISDNNISGLHSMINYINTHKGKKPNYYFEDNSNIIIKKKINNSKRTYSFDDNLTLNKTIKTTNNIKNNLIFEDYSSVVYKKHLITSKKNYYHDDNSVLNNIKKITHSNIYKHYSISNLHENFSTNKTIINNNITRKIIPNFIQEDNYFYFSKNYDTVLTQLTNSINEINAILNIG